MYLDKIKKFQGNEYTAFGTAIHHVCENLVVDHSQTENANFLFESKFLEELLKVGDSESLNKKLVQSMRDQGKHLTQYILPSLTDKFGKRIIDFRDNNLHLVGYSNPIKKKITLKQLLKHLHSLPEQPNAIPYVTAYYKNYWGFCVTHNQKKKNY